MLQGDQNWKNEIGGTSSKHGEMRNAYKVLAQKPGAPRHTEKDNIEISIK
jgi:hypothetical protein